MSDLLIPTHIARAKRREAAAKIAEPVMDTAVRHPMALIPEAELKGDVVYPHDHPIPEGVPQPGQWRVILFPVCQRQKFRNSSLYVAPETIDTQNWTHLLWKVAKVGPLVYQGPAWNGFRGEVIEEAREALKPGTLWLVDAKQPRRFYLDGVLLIVVNDDQLWAGPIDPEITDRMTFKGEGL